LARDAALRAKRGDLKESEYYEDVSEDESIFSLLAERDGNHDEKQFANTILDFDLTLLQNDEHLTNNYKDEEKQKECGIPNEENEMQAEDNDERECEINVNDMENEERDETNDNSLVEDDNGGELDYNDCEQESDYINTQQRSEESDHDYISDNVSATYDINSDVSSKDENNNDYESDVCDYQYSDISVEDDEVILSSDGESAHGNIDNKCTDVVPSKATTRTQTLILTFTKKTTYIGQNEIGTHMSADQEYYDDFE
jgi:hypothetical protein